MITPPTALLHGFSSFFHLPASLYKILLPFFGHYFLSNQRKKGYVSALIPHLFDLKTALFVGTVLRHIMAEP